MKQKYTTSDRGFKHLEPIVCTYNSEVRVYESSAATRTCIWLSIKCDPKVLSKQASGEGVAHLTIEQAEQLQKQLKWMIKNHYHNNYEKSES